MKRVISHMDDDCGCISRTFEDGTTETDMCVGHCLENAAEALKKAAARFHEQHQRKIAEELDERANERCP